MAEAVQRYAAQGYTWMKFHLWPFENVLEQTKAIQQVAPEGFQIHYDFTMYGGEGSRGRHCHSTLSLTIVGCHSLVIYIQCTNLAVIAAIFSQSDRVALG